MKFMDSVKLVFAAMLLGALIAFFMVVQTKLQRENDARVTEIAAEKGAKSVAELAQRDGYFIVRGVDLHNVAGDLIGKKICFRGTVSKIEHVPANRVCILTSDECYFMQLFYGSVVGKNVPADLREQFEKGGLQLGVTVHS